MSMLAGMTRPKLRLVSSNEEPESTTKFVPIRLLLALSGRCDCTDCCAVELAKRAGRPWVHPDARARRPWMRVVRLASPLLNASKPRRMIATLSFAFFTAPPRASRTTTIAGFAEPSHSPLGLVHNTCSVATLLSDLPGKIAAIPGGGLNDRQALLC